VIALVIGLRKREVLIRDRAVGSLDPAGWGGGLVSVCNCELESIEGRKGSAHVYLFAEGAVDAICRRLWRYQATQLGR
jgi:hypothetical protein